MSSAHFSFIVLDSVDSTNNYAMAKVHSGMTKHGDGYFTANQSAGKGQRGKTWVSSEGMNIALSVVIEPEQLKIPGQFNLSMAVALACFDFFSKYAGDDTTLKWPNDIYWRDRKAGGILIENVFRGAVWKYAVAGVGININQVSFDGSIKNAVSLKQITGKNFDVQVLAQELHLAVMGRVNGDMKKLLEEYNSVLYKKGNTIKLKKQSRVFETEIKGVDSSGRLITLSATEERFDFGEIEWIL